MNDANPTLGFEMEVLALGVRGYTVENGGDTYIPFIEAESEGNGDVGRFLDSLSPTRTWKIPTVISGRLKGMLERRGFKVEMEWSPEFEEHAEVYVKRPTTDRAGEGEGR